MSNEHCLVMSSFDIEFEDRSTYSPPPPLPLRNPSMYHFNIERGEDKCSFGKRQATAILLWHVRLVPS